MKIIKVLVAIMLMGIMFLTVACTGNTSEVKTTENKETASSVELVVTDYTETTIACSTEISPATDEWQIIPSLPTETPTTPTPDCTLVDYFEVDIIDNKISIGFPICHYPKTIYSGTYGGFDSIGIIFVDQGNGETECITIDLISNADIDDYHELMFVKADLVFYFTASTVEIWHNDEFLCTALVGEDNIKWFFSKRY